MINQFELIDSSKIDQSIKVIKEKSMIRTTIIDDNGTVLYESDRKVEGMENHGDRPEIKEASLNGIGSSIRYSKSVGVDFLYIAKYQGDRFIRMAYALSSIKDKFFKFWLKAMILFAFAMGVAFWIAMKMNRKITRDLEHINIGLDNLLNKKYKRDFDGVSCCKEFETISKQIQKVSSKLKKRDRQKAKYTKKLKLLSKKQGDIISAISHEFKNPVAAIVGYTQTVKEDPDIEPKTRDRFLDKVLKNSQKITSMIDRLSLAIKLENDSFSPKFSKFKLLTLAEEVKDTLIQKYPDREIVLAIDDIIINADRVMFDNLLINLIENALKYSEDEVIVKSKNNHLEVIDKGIGISQEDIKKITKRFYRVDSLSWDNSIGVGLYIVKYILKLHNSYLEIESIPKKGSKFWFNIKGLKV
jgi:signal transduction histidine kinase